MYICISLHACTYVCTCTAAERGEPKTGERVVCNGADTRPHPTKIGYMSSRSYNTASNLAFVHNPRSKHLWISSRCWWQDSVLKWIVVDASMIHLAIIQPRTCVMTTTYHCPRQSNTTAPSRLLLVVVQRPEKEQKGGWDTTDQEAGRRCTHSQRACLSENGDVQVQQVSAIWFTSQKKPLEGWAWLYPPSIKALGIEVASLWRPVGTWA